MKQKPLVTVACATYNHEKYIRKTLDGFMIQETTFPVEYIIHDDCSTDNTVSIIKEYQKKFPDKIKLIEQKDNQYSHGVKPLKTFVYPIAQGKYVALCEGDDYWTDKNKLQKQISFMEEHPEYSCTYHAVNYINNNGKIIKNDRVHIQECDITANEMIEKGGLFCATLSLCFKFEYVYDYPLFRQMADVGDYPMQILMALRGKIHYFPDIMGCYRVSSIGSWTEKNNNNKEKRIKHLHTEIHWLKELDKYTNYKYTNSIYYSIIENSAFDLYIENQMDIKELGEYFSHMTFSILKIKCFLNCSKKLIRYKVKKNKIIYKFYKLLKSRGEKNG